MHSHVVGFCMASVCEYTQPDGTATQRQKQQALNDPDLSPIEKAKIIEAADNNDPVSECATQQGVPPALVGIGVLGLGAVAVALSQRGE